MNLIDLINVRPIKAADLNFILDSSVKCLSKYSESMFKGWQHKDVCGHLESLVLHCLSHKNYHTFVACHKDDEDHILAYAIANSSTNHVILQFTKYPYRKLGLQKHFLLPLLIDMESSISVNFQTKEMLRLATQNKATIRNQLIEDLISENLELKQ